MTSQLHPEEGSCHEKDENCNPFKTWQDIIFFPFIIPIMIWRLFF